MREQCYCCRDREIVDQSGINGWTEVPCPVCTKPRTVYELATLAQTYRDELDRMMLNPRVANPSWR